MRIMCSGTFVKAHGHIKVLVHFKERVPVVRMPEVPVDHIWPHERSDGAQFIYTSN